MATVPRQYRAAGTRFLAALGVSAIPIGILAPLAPQWWEGKWWLVLGVLVLAVVWGLLALRPKTPMQVYEDSNVKISVVFGDMFEQGESAMVGMSRTFDTEPGIIADNSLQAAFLRAVYRGSVSQLDQDLASALANVSPIDNISKTGKTVVYPMGTVATLTTSAGIRYYCTAYTTMDADNRAHGTVPGLIESLERTWEAADKAGSGRPICVPLIGEGQSRIHELTPELALRLIVCSFLLRTRRQRFTSELRIVIQPTERHKINTFEFQAFLTSLASS